MTWEEALYLIEHRVNGDVPEKFYSKLRDKLVGGATEEPIDPNAPPPSEPPKPYWDLRVYASVQSTPPGLKVAFKKASEGEEAWQSLGFLAVQAINAPTTGEKE